jgi:hypothetical protein
MNTDRNLSLLHPSAIFQQQDYKPFQSSEGYDLDTYAEDWRNDTLPSGGACVVCSRPPTWAPSPITHTIFTTLDTLHDECRLCNTIFVGVSHFACIFDPTYVEAKVWIRFDPHLGFTRTKSTPVVHVTVQLDRNLGMDEIELRLSIHGPFAPFLHETKQQY